MKEFLTSSSLTPPAEDVMGDHNQLVPGYLKNIEYAVCTAKQCWRGLNLHPLGVGSWVDMENREHKDS